MLSILLLAALSLQATEIKRIPAADADQGVASDGHYLYAISNHAIAQIDPATGQQLTRWDGPEERFPISTAASPTRNCCSAPRLISRACR